MAIVKFPAGMVMPTTLICVLCDRRISPAEAVAGQLDADQNQAFACNGHFWDTTRLILGWADFNNAQQQTLQHRGTPVHYFTGTGGHHA